MPVQIVMDPTGEHEEDDGGWSRSLGSFHPAVLGSIKQARGCRSHPLALLWQPSRRSTAARDVAAVFKWRLLCIAARP
jgi:hypothetical protein